jgi:hypothetical protein
MKAELWLLLEKPEHHKSDGDGVLEKHLIKYG